MKIILLIFMGFSPEVLADPGPLLPGQAAAEMIQSALDSPYFSRDRLHAIGEASGRAVQQRLRVIASELSRIGSTISGSATGALNEALHEMTGLANGETLKKIIESEDEIEQLGEDLRAYQNKHKYVGKPRDYKQVLAETEAAIASLQKELHPRLIGLSDRLEKVETLTRNFSSFFSRSATRLNKNFKGDALILNLAKEEIGLMRMAFDPKSAAYVSSGLAKLANGTRMIGKASVGFLKVAAVLGLMLALAEAPSNQARAAIVVDTALSVMTPAYDLTKSLAEDLSGMESALVSLGESQDMPTSSWLARMTRQRKAERQELMKKLRGGGSGL